jgi:hypothetical protein
MSFNRAVTIAVDGLDETAMEVIHAHELGIQDGVKAAGAERAAAYAASVKKFGLILPCRKCGQPVEL